MTGSTLSYCPASSGAAKRALSPNLTSVSPGVFYTGYAGIESGFMPTSAPNTLLTSSRLRTPALGGTTTVTVNKLVDKLTIHISGVCLLSVGVCHLGIAMIT